MSKKDKNYSEEAMKSILALSVMMSSEKGMLGGLFPSKPHRDKRYDDVYHLGQGLSLVVDKFLEDNESMRYSHLYKGLDKISDDWFRLGGLNSGFNDRPYAQLIHYVKGVNGHMDGKHVIIDAEGKIVLKADGSGLDYIHYFKGIIATYRNEYINLSTGETIVKTIGGSKSIESKKYLFVNHNYNYNFFKEKEYKLGVYKIDFETGEYEIFE
jgi:hypothetical protein